MEPASQPVHSQKGPFLRTVSAGERFIGFYVVHRKRLEPFRDPSRGHYLTLVLGDRSGQRLARVWEDAEALAAEIDVGDVVKIQGEMETYRDRLQVRVLRIRKAAEGEFDWRDMLPASPHDPEAMLESVLAAAEAIENPHLHVLVMRFYGDEALLEALRWVPAGRKVHHAYLSGLLEHLTEMLALADRVLEIYPQIDADLLRAGILLHDIGKVRELHWGLNVDYTDEGRLLGHIVLGDEMVAAAIESLPEFPPALALRLRHMLLAHHNRYEWGSPRRPQTLEAIALAKIDDLSAQVNRFWLLLQQREAGETWTPYDRLLERRLYAGESDLSVEEESQQR
ncbi:MAG TPA: HD domain-containing protein [Chloroflexi bacterium]|nr:HD domain-containing protein [Chloroflexota bacterium]